jgi:hypothetical protein
MPAKGKIFHLLGKKENVLIAVNPSGAALSKC